MTDPVIGTVDVSVFTVPTDALESTGTTAWDSTTMVLVRTVSGGTTGMGWTYGAADQDARWFEEPVSSNDLDGLREIRNSVSADVAAGEYGFDLVYFRPLRAPPPRSCRCSNSQLAPPSVVP